MSTSDKTRRWRSDRQQKAAPRAETVPLARECPLRRERRAPVLNWKGKYEKPSVASVHPDPLYLATWRRSGGPVIVCGLYEWAPHAVFVEEAVGKPAMEKNDADPRGGRAILEQLFAAGEKIPLLKSEFKARGLL
ncbi:MAG: hypothetical protein IT198_17350 [Acidimicrobiia bacterium]|nr:hypothetical protein [Acidimicrobiia bacterium]